MPILKFVQYIPTKDHIRFRRTLKVINQFAKTLIDEKTEAVLAGNGEKKKDIMSILGTSLAFFGPGVLGGQLNATSILTTSPMSASARSQGERLGRPEVSPDRRRNDVPDVYLPPRGSRDDRLLDDVAPLRARAPPRLPAEDAG